MLFFRRALLFALCLAPLDAWATQAKIDPETCNALRLEEIKFRQSGILDDMSKGAAWAKANLSADRLREIEHYLQLDEQVQFGCRDAKITAEAKRASEAAARIEINSDADPTAPIAKDPPKPGAAPKKALPKKAVKKKAKPSDPKVHSDKSADSVKPTQSEADVTPHPPVVVQSDSEEQTPSLPAFGFGETMVLPHSAT
ncbi:MAG: hypothetical protein JSR99_14835 [Proteobacteria bacterium]|nr:hypothetical protein [Pseudomonadota bacterium]